jgi:hypothetical protein
MSMVQVGEGAVRLSVTSTSLEGVADSVTILFEELFAVLESLRERLVARFADGPPAAASVVRLVEPHARELLRRPVVLGGGFVAARDALADRPLYLAWWQGESQQLLGQSEAPVSGDPLDYTRREWFRVPERTGRRHVTGPYVDYVCTDEYVVTSTAPVLVAGRMVGVVGVDTLVETLEETLLPVLGPAGATVVNDHGRVLASADHRLDAGTVLDLTACSKWAQCAALPLRVLLA